MGPLPHAWPSLVTAGTGRRSLIGVAFGGVVGASARYGVGRLLPVHEGAFPWATFGVNVSGSFLIGVLLVVLPANFRPFLVTGFLGAYTTYSAFAVETDVLIRDGHVATAALYAAASLVAGLAAVTMGMFVARRA